MTAHANGIQTCSLCGANIQAMGKTTCYYKNLDQDRIQKLELENRKLRQQLVTALNAEGRLRDRVDELEVLSKKKRK